jgi:hypothetical protein
MGDVVPNHAPVLQGVEVNGGGWVAGQAVDIGYATSSTADVKALGVATADDTGNVKTSVTVPDVAPGLYSMVMTQGSTKKSMPFEVQATAGQVATAAAPAPAGPASGQEWSGLRADGAKVQGLADLPATTHSSSPLPVVALALGASLVLGGLALVEVRRRKVHAHAEVSDLS